MNILPAQTENDLEEVRQLFREYAASLPFDLFLVGDLDGQVVATVMAGFDGHRGWVHLVAVSPAHRKRGFGRLMMAEAEKRLTEIGCMKINLQVRSTNQGVVSFYEKLGYAVEERVSMGKRLQ